MLLPQTSLMETSSILAATAALNCTHNIHNAFVSTLDRTAALLCACTSRDELTNTEHASPQYTGRLKTLRLVSRGVRVAASRAVTSFELTINRELGRDMHKMVQLLEGAGLQCFGVRVIDTVLPWSLRKPLAGDQSK